MVMPHRPTTPGRTTPPGAARRLARALAVTAAATTAVAIAAAGGAQAVPTPDKRDVKAQVDQLYSEAEQASEQSNAAEETQRRLQGESAILQAQVATGQDALNRMRGQLSTVAAAEYRSGGMDPSVQLMLSANPERYLDEARSLDQVAEQRAASLREVIEQQRRLDQRRAEATSKLAELDGVRKSLVDSEQQVQQRLKRAQDLLNTLDARDRAVLAAQDARDAQDRAARGGERVDLGNQPPSSDRAAVALAAALSKIGSPYVYGSTGPGSFDCSGLMYWAWRQAGVTLPRTSQAQAFGGQRISLAEARPGDLVIFFRDMHHVGMYAGGGVVVHAPYPGARVRYESVAAMPVAAVVRP
ncbi:cell wall-associated NlpC family hydrolase [Kitasatospora sp. MAP12-15]|uniref:C40 family peptidase n=1 Tax=unclassified Kitasatospora TaxID=2633591 RepID=UPI002473732A|nr:C40 family peptidase [Kitasatospora sp. MAP12-44]MDH6110053.1 cell wall-associated NlpC family hydrolase [Kitasatospora sp. MAP12-44]